MSGGCGESRSWGASQTKMQSNAMHGRLFFWSDSAVVCEPEMNGSLQSARGRGELQPGGFKDANRMQTPVRSAQRSPPFPSQPQGKRLRAALTLQPTLLTCQ